MTSLFLGVLVRVLKSPHVLEQIWCEPLNSRVLQSAHVLEQKWCEPLKGRVSKNPQYLEQN